MTAPFAIAGRRIGADQPPYVIAEAGVNHNGDLVLARRLIDVAADAGADAVKFQTFEPASLATAGAALAVYQRAGSAARSQREMLSALALRAEDWAELAAHAHRRGITFLSTPFDAVSIELLANLRVPAFKIGSGDLTNALLLRAAAQHRRPMILSTGMASIDEVNDAVRLVGEAGATSLALLHCASVYPAAPEDLNLRAIDTLAQRFDLVIGFSDHTDGMTAPIAAVARGAAIIEKHVTLDRALPGPDHAASIEAGQLTELVRAVHDAWIALGDGVKLPRPGEADTMLAARRSLIALRDLPAGHRLEVGDLDARRPGSGISPMRIDEIVGRRLAVAVTAEQLLRPGDVDPPLAIRHRASTT